MVKQKKSDPPGLPEFKVNRLNLSFTGGLEKAFLKDYFKKSLLYVRKALFFAFLFYGVFAVVSLYRISELKDNPSLILYAVYFPYVLAILLFSFYGYFKKYMQISILSVALLAGFGIVAIIPFSASQSFLYNTALIFVFIYVYIFFKLRFIWASAAGWMILTAYWITAVWLNHIPSTILINNSIIFITINIIGMYICYRIELYLRKDFMQAHILEAAKKIVNTAKQDIDKVKKERKQLAHKNKDQKQEIVNHKKAEKLFEYKLKIERLASSLSNKFINLDAERIDTGIIFSLKLISEFASAERSYIYLFGKNGTQLEISHEWRAKGIKSKIPIHEKVDNDDFSWLVNTIKQQIVIQVSNINDLPANANTLKAIFKVEDIKSLIIVPMVYRKTVIGFIGFDSVRDEIKWTESIAELLRISGEVFVNAIRRKKTAELNRRSEEKLRILFERTEDVVFISAPDGKIIDINPAGAKMLGYSSKDELLQKHRANDFYFNPEDRKAYQRVLEQYGNVRDYELVLKRKDGQKVVVLETTTAVRNDKGDIISYEGIMRDVTDKKQLEQQLLQSQKMESIGLLAGGIAHDFNNIMTAINGYADMILMNMKSGNPHYKDILNILKGGKRAENLTRQLLAFSRKQIIEPKIIDINKVISDLNKMMRRLIGEDITLETKLLNEISRIKADPVQIQQILVNLIVNSRYAIDKKTDNTIKKITIGTEEVRLDKNFVILHPGSKEGRYVVISVTDTGIGMDEETKSKIFEPFFTTKEEGKGTGLGLSTVYGIVKQNNSSIYIDSELGKGATFRVYWPATHEELPPDFTDDSSELSTEVNETILVVEDDEAVRDIACSFLKSLGYKALEASNGVEALKLIRKKNLIMDIDLLLTDMVMPEMGGEELAQKIKEINPDIKILLSSGYTDSQIVKCGMITKDYHFLPKPYSMQQMAKKVRDVLDNRIFTKK